MLGLGLGFVKAHLRICPAVNNQPWSSRDGGLRLRLGVVCHRAVVG